MAKVVGSGLGVEARQSTIRVQFKFEGKMVRETLQLAPTTANLKFAANLVQRTVRAIEVGTFDYAEFFPKSKRVQAAATLVAAVGSALRSVRHFGELFFASKGDSSSNTKSQYRRSLNFWYRQHLPGLDGKPDARQLGDMDVMAVGGATMAALVGSIKWKSGKMANNTLTPLRGLFAMATRELKSKGMMNPLEDVKPRPHQPTECNPFEPHEVELILADMREHYNPQVANYFEMQFKQGPRPEETIAFLWSDFDKRTGTIKVVRARCFRGQTKPLKNKYSVRHLELCDDVLEMLKRQRLLTGMKAHGHIFENPETHIASCRLCERPHYGKGLCGSHYQQERRNPGCLAAELALHKNRPAAPNRPWHDERSQRETYWKPTLARLELLYRKPYQCRHTYATALIMAGEIPNKVSRQLGHRTMEMLYTTYSKWLDAARGAGSREKANAVWAQAKRA